MPGTFTAILMTIRTQAQAVAQGLALVLLCLALYLPGLTALPVVDRDEARFAQASRQMVESGDPIAIHFQNESRLKKPIGIYWLQAASASALGGVTAPIWAYRVPSLIGATIAVLLTAWIGIRLFGTTAGMTAAAILAGTVLLGYEARQAKTDAVLLATIVAVQGALAARWQDHREGRKTSLGVILTFWVGLAASILVKGPIVLLVSGATIAALAAVERQVRWLAGLRPRLGLPLLLVLVLPWFIAIMIQTGGAFFHESVGHDLVDKMVSSQETHGAWPGYYVAAFLLTFWPYTLLAIPAAPWAWRHRREPAVLFCLAWLVPAWLIFELVPTKLPHYVLPLYPALALLTGAAAAAMPAPGRRLSTLALVVWAIPGIALLAALLGLVPVVSGRLQPGAIGLAVGAAALLWLAPRQTRLSNKMMALALAGGLITGGAFQFVLPSLDPAWVSDAVKARIDAVRPCPTGPIAAAGYTEPSLVFDVGTGIQLTDGSGAAAIVGADACAVAVVDITQDAAFHTALSTAVRTLGQVRGFNYSRGKPVDLTLYARQ
ncbi:MAG: glycosyltransferase family 39 protein [Azospirillaceae bacterium]|nr:glycosyltransferase family 39 protein [Azospirillaceae bacterium]